MQISSGYSLRTASSLPLCEVEHVGARFLRALRINRLTRDSAIVNRTESAVRFCSVRSWPSGEQLPQIGRSCVFDVEKDHSRHYARDDVLDAVAEEAETRGGRRRWRESEFAAKWHVDRGHRTSLRERDRGMISNA